MLEKKPFGRLVVNVERQDEVVPGLFRLTLTFPSQKEDGTWENKKGKIFFDKVITNKTGAERNFLLFINSLEMRDIPLFGNQPFILSCSPFVPGRPTKAFEADK